MADYDPFEDRPKLKKWWIDVKEATNPAFDEAHLIVNKIIKNQENKKAKL